jgi:exodeoxyribonuclease V beta subunit
LPSDHTALTTLRARAAGSGGGLGVVAVTRRQIPVWAAPPPEQVEPVVALFDRDLDLDWRRTSYSSLTATAHAVGATAEGLANRLRESGEAESPGSIDEPDPPVGGPDGPEAGAPAPPLAGLPGGTAFGTLVHEVLEVADPAEESTDLLIEHCRRALVRTPLADVSAEILGPALAVALRTPLGSLASGRCLAEIGREDRLRELEFELPLAGGDRPGRSARLAQLGPVLAAHLAPDDPLHAWLPRLQRPELAEQPLRGYLTGSIDVVLRIRPGHHGEAPRYVVVDYKTNRLHPADVEPTTAHYRSAALSAAMQAADYPLQALLYQVALHRYLTWRQPGYDPQLHLGGTLYLFLRGMQCLPQKQCPPAGPVGDDIPGVFAWRPPTSAILAVDELLAGG